MAALAHSAPTYLDPRSSQKSIQTLPTER